MEWKRKMRSGVDSYIPLLFGSLTKGWKRVLLPLFGSYKISEIEWK